MQHSQKRKYSTKTTPQKMNNDEGKPISPNPPDKSGSYENLLPIS
jgi:hypothetical protein